MDLRCFSATLAMLMGFGLSAPVAAQSTDKERCYGVALKGKNDCAANGHGCAGQAKVDSDPNEWIVVPQGVCDKIVGGRTTPGG